MKRVLFSMVLLMTVSFSFAQMKIVKEAKRAATDVNPDLRKADLMKKVKLRTNIERLMLLV